MRAALPGVIIASACWGFALHADAPIVPPQIMDAEMRALLREMPELVAPAREIAESLRAAPDYTGAAYAEEAQGDIALLEALASELFAGADVAIFTGPDCADCAAALAELQQMGVSLRHHDIADAKAADLAAQLGLDVMPSYALPRMMLRGHMPPVVLEKYLAP
ncbi:MAG: disulfide bond formation protein DsbA [Sulfitobacter sp.]